MAIMGFHWRLWVCNGNYGFSLAIMGFKWQLWVVIGNYGWLWVPIDDYGFPLIAHFCLEIRIASAIA